MPNATSSLVDAGTVADRLGVQPWAVYDLARRGILPHVRIGRRVRFDPHKIEAWIADGGNGQERAAA